MEFNKFIKSVYETWANAEVSIGRGSKGYFYMKIRVSEYPVAIGRNHTLEGAINDCIDDFYFSFPESHPFNVEVETQAMSSDTIQDDWWWWADYSSLDHNYPGNIETETIIQNGDLTE